MRCGAIFLFLLDHPAKPFAAKPLTEGVAQMPSDTNPLLQASLQSVFAPSDAWLNLKTY